MTESQIKQKPAFQLKGSLFTLTVMQLDSTDVYRINKHLEQTIQRSPNFFNNAPIIVDLKNVMNAIIPLNFEELKTALGQYPLIPVGVTNGSEEQYKAAKEAGFGVIHPTKPQAPKPKETPKAAEPVKTESNKETKDAPQTKVITQPVRSGQQIYAQNSDLVILNSVSAGAELMADGHIHVYGTLRGRAMAGVSGNKQARIFCLQLAADLISIAGYYKIAEDMNTSPTWPGIQMYLNEQNIQIASV